MKLFDIIKAAGSIALNTVAPGAVQLINTMLPNDKQLPDNATGSSAMSAIDGLSPADKALLMDKELEVNLANIQSSRDVQIAMLKAEQASTHTTRPAIAKGAFRLVAFIAIMIVCGWFWAVVTKQPVLVKAIVDGWPFVCAVIAPFVGWLNRYFGILKTEQNNRMQQMSGAEKENALVSVIKAFKK